MQALPQQSKSVNPFDTSEPSQVQTPMVCETSNLWLSLLLMCQVNVEEW